MNRWIAAFAFLAGCDKLFGLDEINVDASADAKVFLDAPPNGTVCAGGTNGGPLHFCEQQSTLQPRTIANLDVDTSVDAACDRVVPTDGAQPPLCLLLGSSVMISGTVTAHGSRPLVIVAMSMLTLTGTVDVSSQTGRITGASANDGSCSTTNNGAPQGVGASTSGGGAGGSFGTAGGNGGAYGGTSNPTPAQLPIDGSMLAVVRGGCRGGNGGADHENHFGAGGDSGGAVYLTATSKIVVQSGKLLANGAGGGGGSNANAAEDPGGGGGGAGGLIMLDAPLIDLEAATLMANGGGGGGGQGAGASAGGAGGVPDPTRPFIAASGGTGGQAAGNGGIGANLTPAGAGGDGTAGTQLTGAAGGGGGGDGVIRFFGSESGTSSQITPPAS